MKTLKKNKKLIIVGGILVILFLTILLSSLFGNYETLSLRKNKKEIFTINDLKVNKLGFLSSKDEVIKELGYPKDTKEYTKNNYEYVDYIYPGLTLTLKENYSDYKLVKAEITSMKYKTSRNIRVGNKVTKVLNKYKVENKKGNYIYKNYTKDALKDNLVKGNVYYGYRTKKEIEYINKDAYSEGLSTNVAELKIEYKLGRIKKITWSYDVR